MAGGAAAGTDMVARGRDAFSVSCSYRCSMANSKERRAEEVGQRSEQRSRIIAEDCLPQPRSRWVLAISHVCKSHGPSQKRFAKPNQSAH